MRKYIKEIYEFARRYNWSKKLIFFMYLPLRLDNKNSLFYCKYGNFGDELNDDLMRYFEIKYRRTIPLGANLCCIGSILLEFVNNSSKSVSKKNVVNILGSGFMSEARGTESFMFSMKIYALRGILSKQRCERAMGSLLPDIVLGDPGLLIRRIYPHVKLSGIYDVGIICHTVDKDSELIQNINLNGKKVLFIDIEQEPSLFVEQVAQCKFILSSAMHGLICADSMGIPNKHIILSDKVTGGEYKFRDYYSVFPTFKYVPIYLKNKVITYREIDKYKKEYNITFREVEEIRNNLEAAFNKFKRGYQDE